MKNNLFAMLLLTASFSLLGGCFDREVIQRRMPTQANRHCRCSNPVTL